MARTRTASAPRSTISRPRPSLGRWRGREAALDCGLLILKDIAFERAIEGELIPVFSQGKLMGYRRKRNDALLIFCLRHYGQDAQGRRVTVNYFSTRASAGAASADGPSPDSSPKREGPGVGMPPCSEAAAPACARVEKYSIFVRFPFASSP